MSRHLHIPDKVESLCVLIVKPCQKKNS